MAEYIKKDDVLECFHDWIDKYGDVHTADEMPEYDAIEALPTIEVEHSAKSREIGYSQCADALLKMWMDDVLADREYNRITEKLNKHYRSKT